MALKIKVKKGNIERALKEYKSKIIKTRQMREINEKKEFEKPSVKNRRIKQKGEYKEKRRRENE
jgi:small subunit ribosomal protein S21